MAGFGFNQWQEFPRDFHVMEDERGNISYVEELEEKVCRYVSEDAIVNAIIRFAAENLSSIKDGLISHAEAVACFKLWRALAPNFDEEIVPVAQASEDVLCWRKLEFDFAPGETPTFDEMFSRISNADALKAWIGSLFVAESDRQQYAWLHGDGMNGKGELARFLRHVFGKTFSAQQPPVAGDRFWLAGLLGSRLVVFADCNDFQFPVSGLFKSLTGGDAQKIEEKGRNCYTADLMCKVLFLSNVKPQISGGQADKRRIVYCEIGPLTTTPMPSAAYAEKLQAEGPAFLHKCLEAYNTLAPKHSTLTVDHEKLEDLIEENYERWSVLFDKYFIVAPREHVEEHKNANVKPSELQKIWELEKLKFTEIRSMQTYMRTKGIERTRLRMPDGNRPYRYAGVRLKNLSEQDEERGKEQAEKY